MSEEVPKVEGITVINAPTREVLSERQLVDYEEYKTDAMSEYYAFSERIGQEVALRPLTEEHLYELVEHYLDTARQGDGAGIAPFTEESLDFVLQRSQGNIRQALAICSRVLDRVVDAEAEHVDADFVRGNAVIRG